MRLRIAPKIVLRVSTVLALSAGIVMPPHMAVRPCISEHCH